MGGGGSLVGRQIELGTVRAAVDDALRGVGTGAVVTGEAGIGKTRLVNEVAGALRDDGITVVWASATEPIRTPGYWHWVQLLRALAQGTDRSALVDDLGDDAAELSRLVPALRAGVEVTPPGAPEGDDPRFRLFDAVASFLRRLTRRQPIVLVLDDLHTADAASLHLLRFVLAHTRLDPIGVIATAREAHTESLPVEITAGLHDIERSSTAVRLSGLAADDVETLLRQHVDERDAARLAPAVHDRSRGNPLFVRELALLLAIDPDGTEVPASIRAVVDQRLAVLPAPTRSALRVAAVAGEEFSVDVVAHAARLTDDDVIGDLDAAMRAGIVVARGGRTFGFSHALLREAIAQEIAIGERARLHRAVGDAIEATSGTETPVAELARHYVAGVLAADDGKAAAYAERAGRRAIEQLAYEDAAAHLRAALAVRIADERRVPVLLALGDAELRAGRVDAARAAFVDAAAQARLIDRPDLLADAALGLGSGLDGFEVRLFDHAQITLLNEALDALAPGPSATRARATARLSVALTFAESDARRRALADDAIAMAREVGDDLALAAGLSARCDATAGPDHTDARLEAATEIVRLAVAAGDLGLELLGRRHRLVALLEGGDMPAVDAEIERYDATARAIRQPLYQWYVPLWRGMRALMDGRIADARSHHDDAIAVGQRATSHNAALNCAVLAWNIDLDEGRWRDAAAGLSSQLALADGIYGEPFWVAIVTPHLHRAEAVAALDRLLARDFTELPRDAVWLAAMTYAADTAGVVGHRDAAAQLYELIEPFRARFAVDAIGAACYGSMARPLGVVATVLGRRREALAHFDEALAAHRAAGANLLVGETLHDLGLALRTFGNEDAAARALDEAATLFRSIEMDIRADLVPTSAPHVTTGNVFRLEGDHWQLSFNGRAVVVGDSKGLHDIATLLSRPGREVHVADLVAGTDPGDGATRTAVLHGSAPDAVLDDRARSAYRAKLVDLRDELDEAEANGDLGRAEAARTSMDLLAGELATALGIGGRSRSHADASERARKAVTQRIRNAVKRLTAVHPDLAAHLDRSLRTGRFCCYDPPTTTPWTLDR